MLGTQGARGLRLTAERLMVHRYVRVAMEPAAQEDAQGVRPVVAGAVTPDQRGNYGQRKRRQLVDGQPVLVDETTLYVPHDAELAAGDHVRDVTYRGALVAAGPWRVDSVDDLADMGPVIQRVAVLVATEGTPHDVAEEEDP